MFKAISNLHEKLGNLPVKNKLMLIILGVTSVCILFSVLSFSTYGVVNIKRQMQDELAITGTIISNRINTALYFGNNSSALETLEALKANPSIEKGCVYDNKGTIFANFYTGTLSNTSCPKIMPSQVFFEGGKLKLYRDIQDGYDNRVIGTLYIESNLTRITNYITKQSFIAIAIIFITLIIGYLLARKLQKIISRPLSLLVEGNNNLDKFLTQNSPFFTSGNELTKIELLMGAMLNKVSYLEGEVLRRNKELRDVVRNSESTFNYLSNELKQPLESTLAFGDIISCKAIGNIDTEYISYFNDVYLNVFYYYGIINDTMGFYKNHLKSSSGRQDMVNPNNMIELVLKDHKNNKPKFIKEIDFGYQLPSMVEINIFLDKVIIHEIVHNAIFIFSKYVRFIDKNTLNLCVTTAIDDKDLDAKKFKIEILCTELKNQDISDILENHHDYQNDIHLLRAKLQYLKYLTSYNGGYLDYGDDLRKLTKLVLFFPISQVTVDSLEMFNNIRKDILK
jgi:hypothetical protein